jgi:hypothetical protein
MPIYNPQPGTPVPAKYFYVSPGFSGTSPFFNTLANAVAACDGTTLTMIRLYRGTYVENVTLKNNIIIQGDGIEVTVVQGQTLTTDPGAGGPFNYYLYDVTFYSPGGHGFQMNATGAGVTNIYGRSVKFTSNQAASYGFNFNPTGTFPLHTLSFWNCQFENTAASGNNAGAGLGGNDIPQISVMKNCYIQRIHFSYQAARRQEFIDCDFYDALLYSQAAGANVVLNFYSCTFREFRFTGQANAGSSVTWDFVDCALRQNGGAGLINGTRQQQFFQNCAFEQITAGNDLFIVSETTDSYKFDNCSFKNGLINCNSIQPANMTFVGCVSRNPTGANWITSGAACNVVAVNCVTDKPTQVNVTLVAPSVGNQINIAI